MPCSISVLLNIIRYYRPCGPYSVDRGPINYRVILQVIACLHASFPGCSYVSLRSVRAVRAIRVEISHVLVGILRWQALTRGIVICADKLVVVELTSEFELAYYYISPSHVAASKSDTHIGTVSSRTSPAGNCLVN